MYSAQNFSELYLVKGTYQRNIVLYYFPIQKKEYPPICGGVFGVFWAFRGSNCLWTL
jgi:hypothetical protein